MEEKDRKLKKEVEKVKARHELENVSYQMKMTAAVNEFKKSRTVEYERLIQKFKNKFKDLEKLQHSEITILVKNSNNIFVFF